MKRVLILQNIGKSYGGVWQVNRMLGEELIKNDYCVHIVSIRNNQNNLVLEHDKKLKIYTINEVDEWGTYTGSDIINEIKKCHITKSINMFFNRIKHDFSIKKDITKLHEYIHEYKPDYIITSHYELIKMIPNEYLNKTIHVQHSSVKSALEHKATKETFIKYKDKIKFIFLSKKGMEYAKRIGINNSLYIYNPVRFNSNKVSDVINNKKLITIARLSLEKNIEGMINIAKEIFKDKDFSDWTLEIYGSGDEYDNLLKLIDNHKQIKLMGMTKEPIEKLLTASINLNTSPYEGFCLSILEANECGVPTVSFNFGESASEEIIDKKTGEIAKSIDDYIKKLKHLMKDNDKLLELAKNCKEYNKNFDIKEIIKKWLDLFETIDKE